MEFMQVHILILFLHAFTYNARPLVLATGILQASEIGQLRFCHQSDEETIMNMHVA